VVKILQGSVVTQTS